MTALSPIVIVAAVENFEQPALVAGAELLSEFLGRATGGASPWPVKLVFSPNLAQASPAPTAFIASLATEVVRAGQPFAGIEARWRTNLGRLRTFQAPILICTVFRHIHGRDGNGRPSALLGHIRRLNRLAADLSHDFDTGVVDFDRTLAHIGGRILETDYRLSGPRAAEAAGHTLACSLLSFGLDQAVDPGLQEKAKALLGDINQVDALINRRLAKLGIPAASTPAGHG